MSFAPEIYRQIVSAKRYIDEHYHEPVDLEVIARHACMSKFHFHRTFTRIYRRTPHQYLTARRLEQARLLLAGRDLSVREICQNLGFESIGSFSLLFKREMGHAPSLYRNKVWLKRKKASEQPRSFIPHCFIEQLYEPGTPVK